MERFLCHRLPLLIGRFNVHAILEEEEEGREEVISPIPNKGLWDGTTTTMEPLEATRVMMALEEPQSSETGSTQGGTVREVSEEEVGWGGEVAKALHLIATLSTKSITGAGVLQEVEVEAVGAEVRAESQVQEGGTPLGCYLLLRTRKYTTLLYEADRQETVELVGRVVQEE